MSANDPPLPALPPNKRSRAALGFTASAALGLFELQQCTRCGAVQYPPREACVRCLSESLRWTPQSRTGELISQTLVHHSQNEYFRAHVPWRLGLVRLDAGVTVIAHLHAACAPAPSPVRVETRLDRAGQGVLVALPVEEIANMADDPQLREMSCTPRSRQVLVTDATSRIGQALVRLLSNAGASCVWAGMAPSHNEPSLAEHFRTLPNVTAVSLDVTSESSVEQLAAQLDGRVQILINTAEALGASGKTLGQARSEMDVNYFGLLRLAHEFGPRMRAQASNETSRAVAWVNVLSVFALSNLAAHGTYAASKAAARSFSQKLRGEMRDYGIRVVDVFPGPTDDKAFSALPPPKLSAENLARAILQALEQGIEDVYPGEVAQDLLARWRENPKVLERELSL